MRKIHITESQWKTILLNEMAYPLDAKNDDGKPANFTEYEIAIDNTDTEDDAPEGNVTIPDTIKRSKGGYAFGNINSYHSEMHRLPESKELDNVKNSGFGVNNDKYINNSAQKGGKMIANISNEINSKKTGSRNNTNQVRISRMETYKTSNPELFAKNGGQKALDILKSQTKKASTSHAAKHSSDIKTKNTDTVDGITNVNTENGAYYFK